MWMPDPGACSFVTGIRRQHCLTDHTPGPLVPPAPQLDNPGVFPQRYGAAFPRDFLNTVKTILKRLFRVYAHIYHSHFK